MKAHGPIEVDCVDLVIDHLKEDDALRARLGDSTTKYDELEAERNNPPKNEFLYWVMIALGSVLFGASVAIYLQGPTLLLGEQGLIITSIAALAGSMIFMGALYYENKKVI